MVKIMVEYQAINQQGARFTWEYLVFPEICSHPDYGSYCSYGILSYQLQDGNRQLIMTVHDISTKQDFTEQLAKRFTRQQLSPIHLLEVLPDFLP
jgi:hypothetical protein